MGGKKQTTSSQNGKSGKKSMTWNKIWRKLIGRRKPKPVSAPSSPVSISSDLDEADIVNESFTSKRSNGFFFRRGSFRRAPSTSSKDSSTFGRTRASSPDLSSSHETTTTTIREEDTVYYLSTKQVNSYELFDPIGQGSYGTVYSCVNIKEGMRYAIKVVSRRRMLKRKRLFNFHQSKSNNTDLEKDKNHSDMFQALKQEINFLKNIQHPNIIRLYEVIDDAKVENLYLVFELACRGPIIDIPSEIGLNENTARRFFRDAVCGLKYLHDQNIVHSDIKPSNLLLGDDGNLKISDFGVSHVIGQTTSVNIFSGTMAFSAPEVVSKEIRENIECDMKQADVWSLGITLFCFIYGDIPWHYHCIADLVDQICFHSVRFPTAVNVNPKLTELISCMLAKIPVDRLTLNEVEQHPWVTRAGTLLFEQSIPTEKSLAKRGNYRQSREQRPSVSNGHYHMNDYLYQTHQITFSKPIPFRTRPYNYDDSDSSDTDEDDENYIPPLNVPLHD